MTKIPDQMNTIQALIYKAYEDSAEQPRPHMGISQIGNKCDRAIWLAFRHAITQKHPGRILKLFKFGHDYEDTVIKELKSIGCKIINRQANIDFGSHVSGSGDGIISNVPGREKQTLLLEVKTLSAKSFADLKKKGVQESKPIYYTQVQCYMLGLKLDRCLFYAMNKDNSEIYTEIVRLDRDHAEKAVTRAKKIALSDYMPEPLSADPSWYECRLCDFHKFCFSTKTTDSIHCRTCALSTPTEDSKWLCSKYDNFPIEFQYQRTGCDGHVIHPDLVPYERAESDHPHEAVYIIDGQHVRNGEPDERVYRSIEIIDNPVACAHPDETTEALRVVFDARLVSVNDADPTF